MKLLLDTSGYTALMRGHTGVTNRIRRAEQIFFSTVVAGELLFGFRGGNRFERNLREFEAFLDNPFVTLVPVTMTTADRFSSIASVLKRKGTPIPTNDIWVAAHTVETGAALLTFDRHFERIEGLVIVQFSTP